ncbi:MAG: peptidoglycan/LPS O-acetylase OafA/YrhL [Alteromonas macleodii]|jgi:peptidoglycan/LPS O-acetylase OafA/YrhL
MLTRIPQIDFLRGVAVILVLFRHHPFIPFLNDIGWVGVDLFFVLSGYLVSTLLFNEFRKTSSIRPLRFLTRRGFKIYPLFYVFLLLTVISESLIGNPVNYKNALAEGFFVQNYFRGIWSHTWSLAVEEHFYFVLSALIYVLYSLKLLNRKAILPSIIICLCGCCMLLRLLNYWNDSFSYYTHMFPTHLRIDSLAVGVLLAYSKHISPKKFYWFFTVHPVMLLAIAIILISPIAFFDVKSFTLNVFGLSMVSLGMAILLGLAVSTENAYQKICRVCTVYLANGIAKIGFYSYGIYLFHMFIKKYVIDFSIGSKLSLPLSFAVYFVLSILLGIFTTRLVEIPFLNLRERLIPRIK